VLSPLVLFVGLITFNTVDADGDPLTANGPAVVLASEAAVSVRSDSEFAGTEAPAVVRARSGERWPFVARWANRVRSLWHAQAARIRGP